MFISNTLLKKINLLKKEKETLALNYEQEEKFLTNDLSRKLTKVGERLVIYNARGGGAHAEWGGRVPLVHKVNRDSFDMCSTYMLESSSTITNPLSQVVGCALHAC